MGTLKRFDIHIVDEGDDYTYLHEEEKPDGTYCYSRDALGIVTHLQTDNASISRLLDKVGIKNDGSTEQIHRVRMLADRDAAHVKMIQELSAKIKQLEDK